MNTRRDAKPTVEELRAKPYIYGALIESSASELGNFLPVRYQTISMQGTWRQSGPAPEVRLDAWKMDIEEQTTSQTNRIFLRSALASAHS